MNEDRWFDGLVDLAMSNIPQVTCPKCLSPVAVYCVDDEVECDCGHSFGVAPVLDDAGCFVKMKVAP